jgi:hypothetical protein
MREIKFRGKAIEDFDTHLDGVLKGEWVEGHYYWSQSNLCGVIVTELMEESGGVGSGIMECHIQVDYKTVRQYTGLKDCNGKEIYEGDIVKRFDTDIGVTVEWYEKYACFDFKERTSYIFDLEYARRWYSVIGNIYENPELLEEK